MSAESAQNGMSQKQNITYDVSAPYQPSMVNKNAGNNTYLESLNTQTQTTNVENFNAVSTSQPVVNDVLQEAVNMRAAQEIAVQSKNVEAEEVTT